MSRPHIDVLVLLNKAFKEQYATPNEHIFHVVSQEPINGCHLFIHPTFNTRTQKVFSLP